MYQFYQGWVVINPALGNMPEIRFCSQNMSNHFVFSQIAPDLSFHNIFAFIVTVLLTLLQLKCQGNASDSPFEEYPITVWFATGCLLVCCLLYAIELANFLGNSQAYKIFVHRFKVVLRSLSVASLASMIFPSSFQPFLYGICFIVSVDPQLLFNTIKMFINSVSASIRSKISSYSYEDRGGILPLFNQQARNPWVHPIHVNSD